MTSVTLHTSTATSTRKPHEEEFGEIVAGRREKRSRLFCPESFTSDFRLYKLYPYRNDRRFGVEKIFDANLSTSWIYRHRTSPRRIRSESIAERWHGEANLWSF